MLGNALAWQAEETRVMLKRLGNDLYLWVRPQRQTLKFGWSPVRKNPKLQPHRLHITLM